MRVVVRVVAAVVLAAATGLVVPAPVWAAPCATAGGVSVVVDYHELGGGVQQACDPSGAGKKASALFPDNGFALTYVQQQPGFVCRVNGAPAEDDCVNTPPADAYWGLWWSDGESGEWVYSSEGVGSLDVPDGGYVALSWNGSSSKSPPGVPPEPHEDGESSPSPEPTQQPSQQPTQQPSGQPGGGGGPSTSPTGDSSGSPSPTSTTSPSATKSAKPGADPSASKSRKPDDGKGGKGGKGPSTPSASDAGSTDAPEETSAVADPPETDGGLPVWVAPGLIVALFAGAAAAFVVRRRRAS